ncbi:hypothetical protein BJ878DRAFT_481460 [Calycina marina]|uniref:Ras-GAP domain-containing protein n=1 Tax=Calycina marina TaxID=1763456 RepID=A0A9P7Z0W9_9HELO|nr:hypothetical protein BJ878DRAFT_481460 [Calycina marina]
MNSTGDSNLVVTLVDRLVTRLPHRTGSSSHEFRNDEVVVLTRATLISVSTSCIGLVIETLLQLLEGLSKPYKGIQNHPIHVVHSELYVIGIVADCCSNHWASINTPVDFHEQDTAEYDSDGLATVDGSRSRNGNHWKKRRTEKIQLQSRAERPASLDDDLVRRLLDAIKQFLTPLSDSYVLLPSNILDDASMDNSLLPEATTLVMESPDDQEVPKLLLENSWAIECHTRCIVEYVSSSNWTRILEYLKLSIRTAHPGMGNQVHPNAASDDDRSSLVTFQLISCFWVDSSKLSIIIQEMCSSFLHLRKAFQTTVAIVIPLLIARWLERNPAEFIELHTMHKRLDGGAETLFDMSNTMFEGGRKKSLLFPFQTSLLFLLPDVFEVASNMRESKSASITKKVQFLDMLRKSLRNRNKPAIFCLTTVLRVARHFALDSDAAVLSYALDVNEEFREAVFRRSISGMDVTTIDSSLMTAAFVSLANLSFDTSVESLAPMCLAPNSPPEFKLAIIAACSHFARQTNASDYKQLYIAVSEFVRATLKGAPKPKESYPSQEYTLLKPLDHAAPPELIYNILLFLDSSPLSVFLGAPVSTSAHWDQLQDGLKATFITCLTSGDEKLRNLTSKVIRKLAVEGTLAIWRSNEHRMPEELKTRIWKSTSVTIMAVADRLIRTNDHESHTLIFICDYLESRSTILKAIPELLQLETPVPEIAISSKKLETAFLVSLCSTDISLCQLVTKSIRLFFKETRKFEGKSSKAITAQFQNMETYTEIARKDFRFTGLVAFQKRVRGLWRQMQYPTAGILAAWENIFDKWLLLSRKLHSLALDAVDDKSHIEWRNYSGFLASLGGVCLSTRALASEDAGNSNLKWIDKAVLDSCDETLLSRYMKQSVQLLTSSNVRVRESTRDTLSTELCPSLYLPLFETLESELGVLFDSPRTNTSLSIESRIVFAEQAAALLRSIVEKLGGPTEMGAPLPINISALILNFAKFLDAFFEAPNILRVKIKICQLCETVTQKKELLNLRHDVRIRNQLLEIIFSWIARPGSPKIEVVISAGARGDEIVRLQKDLDRASLKALTDLTYRLPLQPAEGQTDADTSDLKSQMFHTYFNRFLSLLNYETTESGRGDTRLASFSGGMDDLLSTPDLAITALSNLLSANIDVGLKHSLGIGYHEDLDIRTAFVRVLCNILIQGTEFNNLSDAAVNEKYDELLKLLTNDMALTIALCDACPSGEVDEMTISLLNIFDSRGLGFVLLEALIEHEIDETENEAELLRRSCVATKMLSVYAKWKGAVYLKATLQTVLDRLVLTSKDLDLELDPARTGSAEELQKNALQLQIVAKVFIDDICNSATHIPVSFRKICNIISFTVMKRFPEAKFTAVGSFIFLRFFCPAIVAPDAEGLMTVAPSKEMRRGLLLIAKVVQNLANNVLFGAKEPYMYPLNDFLTQNIYRVTTFLREISAPPSLADPSLNSESFDFGSCVALHRFLYDHWDHVRQKIVQRERKASLRSPTDINMAHLSILDVLRKLITNLGPPPMNVSWNRPGIASNTPPSYSRFQHFMLRNAGRNTDSLISNRAVYDGGESKDGLPMICIILRNIDTETADYELLLFGYLKIASRMWHRPFGILIDATCYNGQNEPQDALFKKLDLLTPTELSKQLSRLYVYNMNSAFRKCFRRILRLSAKSDNSAFHPKNVDYHLIGSLQDLQTHFHLSQLHLPKETISVVTDTRYVFQPITRLSKTKGKIEVVIKVGSQFVQVTTTKKQEVVPGLRLHANVNDIFRLSEVDEAPTSIQTEDDSAFGLRTENGKIIMFFTSPRKPDVLQAIRGAKSKYGKELRSLKSFERLVRPQDVPGTLLNIALTNMASSDHILRLASYNLLCALCCAFKYAADSKLLKANELCVSLNPSHFIIDISQQLAHSEPQLTADFLNEFFVGWESFPFSQRPLSLAYMAPWIPGLRTSIVPNGVDGDKAREKIAAIFRKLIEIAISDLALNTTLEQSIWPAIASDEIYIDIFLEEVVKAAMGFGVEDERTAIAGSIVAALGTVTIRGKLLSRLRKALNRSSLRPTRHLPENTVWSEICVLLRLCLPTSFDSGVQAQLFLPEVFHLVTMLANTGSTEIRFVVHRLLINTIHAMCTTFDLEEAKLSKTKQLLSSILEPQSDLLFHKAQRDNASIHDVAIPRLHAIENLAITLSEISIVAAPSVDMSNTWRSRWMSLVASTSFQSNPAIQPRAFTVMGCLAREDVDDDLLYQVLVALRNSITRFMDDSDSEMLIAIVTSLTKMMENLPSASRYSLQLFWLALSLARLVPIALFNCTTSFLEAVMTNIASSGEFRDGKMVTTLLQGRLPIEDAAAHLDENYGIHFTIENFHFALCATLAKGLTDSVSRATTIRVLSTFMGITAANTKKSIAFPHDASVLPYLSLLLSRSMNNEETKDATWLAGIRMSTESVASEENFDAFDPSHEDIKDKELLLNAAIAYVDFHYLEDIIQNRLLSWSDRIADARSTVALHLCGPLVSILDNVLISCQNNTTLESAHRLLRTLTLNPKFSGGVDTTEMLQDVLDAIGFGGLWRSATFHTINEQERQCTALTDRLIELIIA